MNRFVVGMWALLLWGLLCFTAELAHADGLVNLPAEAAMVDLTLHGTRVAAQRRNLKLEVPGESEGARAVLDLRGSGPGPEFNWTVYTLRNASADRRAFVLAIDAQRLPGSGLINLLPFGSQVLSVQWLQSEIEHTRQHSATADAYRFELDPGQAITMGLEGRAVFKGVRIYDVSAFAQREGSLAFLRGAVLAVGFVLTLSILALYGIRTHRLFPSGSFAAFCLLMFAALEAGYLDAVRFSIIDFAFTAQHMRALIESLLAFSTGLLMWAFASGASQGIRQKLPVYALLVLLAAIVASSQFNPQLATQLARGALFLLVVSGFVLAVRAQRNATENVDNSVMFWSAYLFWVFISALALAGESTSPVWHAAVLAGLTAIIGILAFVSIRLSFAQGFLSKPYLQDSSRRSLALSGAQHYLWDWQPQDNVLDVGTELAQSLGHPAKELAPTAANRWFAALLHPADELAYRKSLDLRSMQVGGFLEQELRLRTANGDYHWFALRARALPGAGGNPARLIGTLTDITHNKQSQERLITESIHDPVTGLPTRALFLDRAQRDLGKPLALPRRILMVAIERFKILNEGLGHDLGDQLLLAVGQRIAEILHEEESVARISGTRFAVMHVESISQRDAEDLADDIITALAQPVKVQMQEVYLAASVGISESSEITASADALLHQAETALHEAQSQGPRSIVIFHEDIEDDRAETVAIEADLRRAIDRREIEVFYQPIFHLMSRDIAGFEALARWRHPTRGVLSPSEFIGMAEQAGLINEVGDIVMAEAIRQMGIWQRVLTRNKPVFMSINVSAGQLSDTGFLDRLNMLVAREGVLPYAVKIEITESVVMRFPERARQLIQRLRALGMAVACDDFGTGFSNLASLRDLPFNTLKMDRSFISGEGLSGRGGVILQSVITMAHSLGMNVVAEGIEHEDQAQHLLLMGCEMGQGYALGMPQSPREIHALLAVLPVVKAPSPRPVLQLLSPAVGAAPMAPRLTTAEATAGMEPEELPSIFGTLGTTPPAAENATTPEAKKASAKKMKSKQTRKTKPVAKAKTSKRK